MKARTAAAIMPAYRCRKRLQYLNLWATLPSSPPHWGLSRMGIRSTPAEADPKGDRYCFERGAFADSDG